MRLPLVGPVPAGFWRQAQWQAVLGESPYARDRSNPYYQLPGMAERITRSVPWRE